jgi:hypothetical protein
MILLLGGHYMKRSGSFALAIIAAGFLAACGGTSGGNGPGDGTGSWNGSFSAQQLQGAFSSQSYAMLSGYAEVSYFDSTMYSVYLYNIQPNAGTQPTDLGAYPFTGYLKVFFDVPKAAGTYPLYWNMASGARQTATLYDPTANMNYICVDGSIRIDSIANDGLGNLTISGALAAYADASNYVNGTFSVRIKP